MESRVGSQQVMQIEGVLWMVKLDYWISVLEVFLEISWVSPSSADDRLLSKRSCSSELSSVVRLSKRTCRRFPANYRDATRGNPPGSPPPPMDSPPPPHGAQPQVGLKRLPFKRLPPQRPTPRHWIISFNRKAGLFLWRHRVVKEWGRADLRFRDVTGTFPLPPALSLPHTSYPTLCNHEWHLRLSLESTHSPSVLWSYSFTKVSTKFVNRWL